MIGLKKLIIELTPGEEAKKRGLKHVGWGRYADPASGDVVAVSEKGRLVRLKKPQKPGPSKKKEPKSPELKKEPGQEPISRPKDSPKDSSDIPKIPQAIRSVVSMQIDKLAKLSRQAKEKGEKAPTFNLCKITIPGTNLYCGDNKGIPREQMPQFKGKPREGSPADKLPLDRSGEVDTEPMFRQMLDKHGVKVTNTRVPSDQLKATQTELVGSKVAGMVKALEQDPNIPGITAPIYVSRDGYVIDGHHRWAAITTNAITTGEPADMPVRVIDMDVKDIIPMANKFAQDVGVATKGVTEAYLEKMLQVGCPTCGGM